MPAIAYTSYSWLFASASRSNLINSSQEKRSSLQTDLAQRITYLSWSSYWRRRRNTYFRYTPSSPFKYSAAQRTEGPRSGQLLYKIFTGSKQRMRTWRHYIHKSHLNTNKGSEAGDVTSPLTLQRTTRSGFPIHMDPRSAHDIVVLAKSTATQVKCYKNWVWKQSGSTHSQWVKKQVHATRQANTAAETQASRNTMKT